MITADESRSASLSRLYQCRYCHSCFSRTGTVTETDCLIISNMNGILGYRYSLAGCFLYSAAWLLQCYAMAKKLRVCIIPLTAIRSEQERLILAFSCLHSSMTIERDRATNEHCLYTKYI